MRPLIEFLAELRRARVRVWAEGENFGYQAPKGALAPELLEELRARKAEVLAFCRESGSGAAERPPISPEAGVPGGDPPISPAQQRLWVLDRLAGPSAAYNIALALRFRGRLDRDALRLSLEALLRRHESLRTAFRAKGETAVQVVDPAPPLPFEMADLGHLPLESRLEEARRRAVEEALRPFDLGQAPLVRFVLWRLADEDHVLLINLHHIVSDGRSIEILAEELGTCYAAHASGQRPEMPELPVRYADFARRQRRWLEEEAASGQLDFWKRRLAGLPPLLELPIDRPRPPVSTAAGAAWPQRLGTGPARGLKQLARESGATPYMAYVAGAAVLLAHYTGRDDIAIGCPATHRDRPELERLVGFFVNTLVLRVDLSGNPSFRELLARVRAVAVEAFAHWDVPFEKVVEAIGGVRDPSYPPLVQFTVAMLDGAKSRVSLPRLRAEPFEFGNPIARYDLSLEIHESGGAPDIFWIYNTDLFDRDTVARMARHLENLLEGAVADPECPVADLPLLDEDERRRLVEVWSRGEPAYPPGPFIHRLFEAQAERTPDAVAVAMEGRCLGYAELNARANRLAHHLIDLGVGPEVLVGVHVERSFELVVSLLAVLKADGTYVPLDPDYPMERLAFMVEDARAAVLLTQSHLAGRLPESGIPVVLVDALDEAVARQSADNPDRSLSGESPAYVIYTSGSTGQPKGVVIPHRAILNHMRWMGERFPLAADDVVLQKTPCSFDASVWEFYAPLLAGARLVMARPGAHGDPSYLVRVIRDEAVTVLQMVPTLLQLLVDHPEFAGCRSLRRVFAGGEVLASDLARKAAATGAEVCNLYGPTEATIDATYHVWREGHASHTVPIGRPIAGMVAHVLDGRGRPVPAGIPGELHLGGVGLALCYLRRPEPTAERFVADPFSPDPAAKLYRTGDRVRWLPDGNLEFLGRLDEQVKIRGLRIEPGEIEATLKLHPGVRQAVVVAHRDPARSHVLAAYVAGEPAPAADELRAFLRERLPDYMIPTAFVFLPALPMAPGGKVDRRALPVPGVGLGAEPVPPRDETEAAIADIWAGLLGVGRVGVHDDFFDLGGHSLLAAQIIGRIREAFGTELPSRLLFESGTVAKLAKALETARRATRDEAAAKLKARIDAMDPEQIRELLRRKRAQQAQRQERPESAEPK